MKSLHISAIQYDIAWEDPEANFNYLEKQFEKLQPLTELVILPEMFTTGFSMNTEACADKNEKSLKWLKEQASRRGYALFGSVMVEEQGNYFNRGYFVTPEGKITVYDKRHLFSLGKEHQHFTAGEKQQIVDYKGWKIFLSICYDLRFPVWLRNTESYDLLLNNANWPAVRSYAWKHLLQARAIENQAYVVGLNRIGIDGNKLKYEGNSMVLDFEGKVILHSRKDAHILEARLDKTPMHNFRDAKPFLNDKDNFSLDNEL